MKKACVWKGGRRALLQSRDVLVRVLTRWVTTQTNRMSFNKYEWVGDARLVELG